MGIIHRIRKAGFHCYRNSEDMLLYSITAEYLNAEYIKSALIPTATSSNPPKYSEVHLLTIRIEETKGDDWVSISLGDWVKVSKQDIDLPYCSNQVWMLYDKLSKVLGLPLKDLLRM